MQKGCAHSLSRFDLAGKCLEGFVGQPAELNVADCSNVKIDECFDGFDKDVGNGGITRPRQIKHKRVGFAFDTAAPAASASASAARGGKGAPAESRSVGRGRRIEAVKSGGRDGLIGGDGRDSLIDRRDSLRNGNLGEFWR